MSSLLHVAVRASMLIGRACWYCIGEVIKELGTNVSLPSAGSDRSAKAETR